MCVVRLGPRPLSFCVGVPLLSCVDSSSCVASSSSLPLCVSPPHRVSPVIVVWHCQWVVVLGVCGFSWCRAPMAIHGWWCGHIVVSWSGGEGSSSSSMGWPLTIPQCPCQRWAHLLSDCRPGAANKVSEVGGGMMGWPLTFPSAHITVRDMGAPLVRYQGCTVVLGLQMRLVRWGAMRMGGRSPSPAPSHIHGMGTLPVRCPACTFIRCIERHVDEGHR